MVESNRASAYFTPIRKRQHPVLIAIGSLLIAMLAVAVAASSGLLSWSRGASLYPGGSAALLIAGVLAILVLPAVACRQNYRRANKSTEASDECADACMKDWQRYSSWAAVGGLAIWLAAHLMLVSSLTDANSFPAYWRGIHLLSGVSPLLPPVFFFAGLYLWFWCTLRGLAHFGEDHPTLPKLKDLPSVEGKLAMPMFSRENAGNSVECAAMPLNKGYLWLLLAMWVASAAICWVALGGPWVRTLGERSFGILIFGLTTLSIALILTDGIETWIAWSKLRGLLVHLDRLRLRRTLRAMKGLEWGSIWKLSGHVLEERYRVISFQLEALCHLKNTVEEWVPGDPSARDLVLRKFHESTAKRTDLVKWYADLPNEAGDPTHLRNFQEELAYLAGLVMTQILVPEWQKEKGSLSSGDPRSKEEPGESGKDDASAAGDEPTALVRAAEEFVVLPYLAFIQNILGRLRTIALGCLWLFVSATLAVSSYPFDPLNVLGGIFLAVFLIVGTLTILAYSQMSRDATLSHITDTEPGKLGTEFWLRLIAFGTGPLIGLLTTLFPSITDFVFSWLEPGVQSLK
jgi:hypothetical protein